MSVLMDYEQPLILVHLSSLDSYEQIEGPEPAMQIADNLVEALHKQQGPLFVLDQQWQLNPENRARQRLLNVLWATPSTTIKHDDRKQRWGPVVERLDRRLTELDPERVNMGGFWYNTDYDSGCVTYLDKALRLKGHDVSICMDITGCEDIRL